MSPVLRRAAAVLAVAAGCYLLFFYNLTGVGMLGPDEPRYASIGREMARSGDWITPRLWGEPWFEKPPLLYWMIGAGFRAGLSEDLAPRLGVAILSVAFLLLFWRVLRREFGCEAAWFSTAILATSAAWLGFSHVGATDLPMSAAFAAAMLLGLGWIERGDRRALPAAGALLGVAVLAKGLVPLVLALPLAWAGRARWRDLLRPWPIAAFLVVTGPWYFAIWMIHGRRFFDDFILRHHLERFATDSLRHVQPFWFYLPVFVALLFPWSPLVALLFRRAPYKDPRVRFLLLWLVFGFVFFSAAANKLPGYLLPLIPAAAALAGINLAQLRTPRILVLCAVLLCVLPVVASALPEAVLKGATNATFGRISWLPVLPFAGVAAAVWLFVRQGRRSWAIIAVTAASVAGILWVEASAFPVLDQTVSARGAWRQIAPRRDDLCVADVNRGWRYGLNYYSIDPLPDCAAAPGRTRIERRENGTAYFALTSFRVF